MGKIPLQTCGQIITRECQKIYFRKKVHSCGIFSRGQDSISPLSLSNLYEELWAVWKSRLAHGHRGVLSRILDRMPSNPCCLAASQGSFSMDHLGRGSRVLSRKENSKDTLLELQLQGLEYSLQVPGSIVSPQRRSAVVFGFGGFDVQRTSFFNRWLSVFLPAFHPQLSKEGRGVWGPFQDLVYTCSPLKRLTV